MASNGASKSPLEHVWRQFVPQGHDNALRNAFYNVAAAVFVGGAAAAAWSVYLILQPFVQALLWAVLCGSVLHPLKFSVATSVRKWLIDVQDTKSLLSLSVALLPVTCLDNVSEFVGWYVMNHMRGVIAVTVFLPLVYIVIHHTPSFLSKFACTFVSTLYYTIKIFLDVVGYFNYLVIILIIVYFGMVIFSLSPQNQRIFRRLNLPVWLLTCASISCYWSAARVPLFLVLSLFLVLGIGTEVADLLKKQKESNSTVRTTFDLVVQVCIGVEGFNLWSDHKEIEDTTALKPDHVGEDVHREDSEAENRADDKTVNIKERVYLTTTLKVPRPQTLAATEADGTPKKEASEGETDSKTPKKEASEGETDSKTPKKEASEDETDSKTPKKEASEDETDSKTQCDDDEEFGSNMYLKTVFLACILVELWRHCFLLSLLPLAMAYYCLKKAASYHVFGNGILKGKVIKAQEEAHSNLQLWFESRKEIILPPPLVGVFKLLKRTDRRIVKVLGVSVDSVVTILIIFGFIVFLLIATIFLAVQIQGEGMQLVSLGSHVINASIVNNPQLLELLPNGLNNAFGSALDNGYIYGREWLANMVRSMLGETNDEKAALLEQQVIELWDRVYQAWVVANPTPPYKGPVVTSAAVAVTFDSLVDGLMKTPGLISLSTLSEVVRDNLGTVMSVLEGVWAILLSNLTLVFSATTTTLSLLLGGSLSILNALLNMVVFLSALFYIVSISNEVYKPVAILSTLSPGQMNSLGSAVEDSVNGVFMASFKMGAFYGMWTWLLHSLFSTNIVYIPSALGALFGAVPLLGTYWAAVPGALELVWVHGSPFMGIFLMVAQMLPMSCVDTAVYSEIKGGGHPYLTGLAVAGGIFCWGVQGAIFGPLLLCILLVVTKIYTSLIQSPADFTHRIKKFRRTMTLI